MRPYFTFGHEGYREAPIVGRLNDAMLDPIYNWRGRISRQRVKARKEQPDRCNFFTVNGTVDIFTGGLPSINAPYYYA
jgi:hypothetical protein